MSPRSWLAAAFCALALSAPLVLLVALAHGQVNGCRTHRCWHKVSVRRHVDYAWRWVKAHPMPFCTYVGESSAPGDYSHPYGLRRYRARNLSSSAGGKYQILDRTWYGYGGSYHRDSHPAAAASPLEQEKVARRILTGQGIHAWNRC